MCTATVSITFPDLSDPEANESAQNLLDELRQDAELRPHLDIGHTIVARLDPEAQDFGVTLIAVLGTPAIVILAKAVKSWVERTGTSTIEINGVRIQNIRSQDTAAIVTALRVTPPPRKGKVGGNRSSTPQA